MPVSEFPVSAMAQHCCETLRRQFEGRAPTTGLLVGCGTADEVLYLRQSFASRRIVGVDIDSRFSPLARSEGAAIVANTNRLPFPDDWFEFAAAIHSLEHVGDLSLALGEIWRVLQPGAYFYVGVPNKMRLLGYLGSFDATGWQKIKWNLLDYWAKARGRFENAQGAHAGFTRSELIEVLGCNFDNPRILTEAYLRFKYDGRLPGAVLDLLLSPSLIDYSAPAHYALCQKK